MRRAASIESGEAQTSSVEECAERFDRDARLRNRYDGEPAILFSDCLIGLMR